jgi:branched-chain amino acid transport system permease protein
MVSGYLGYFFISTLNINYIAGLALVVIVMSGFGVFAERFCFRPFLNNFGGQVLIGVAITAILATSVNLGIGTEQFVIPRIAKGALTIGTTFVTWDKVFTFGVGFAVLLGIVLFVKFSKLGLQMQALSQNMSSAALQGVNIHRISAIICALGFGLAAVTGVLMGSMFSLDPTMGQNMLPKILMLIIVAGAGSFGGIFIVGSIMGIFYAVFPLFLPGCATDAVVFLIVCVILLIRPMGFFGHEA